MSEQPVELKAIHKSNGVQDDQAYENVAFTDSAVDLAGSQDIKDSALKPSEVVVTVPVAEPEDKDEFEEDAIMGDDFEDLDQDSNPNAFQRGVQISQDSISSVYNRYENIIWWVIYGVLLAGYIAYFAYAMYYKFGDEGSIRLLWVTCFVVFCVVVSVLNSYFGHDVYQKVILPMKENFFQTKYWYWLSIAIYIALILALVIYIIVEVAIPNPRNLVSLSGIAVYILLLYVFSYNPAKVNWRPVLWGLGLQFIFALLILRTKAGYDAFNWLGNRVTEFLAHTDAGSGFVFGESTFKHHYFAFVVLPVVIFFSTVISVLYYLGVMQLIIKKVAWVMQVSMDTTAAESLNAAGNIFIGQTEAPLMIRPLLNKMTNSELHAVMTGGFATIAGSVLAAYILFKVPANHLLSASVMSAPAALAMSKLFYPETKKSRTTKDDVKHMGKGPERSVIQAASNGASASIKLVANIAVNLIAFLAILQFVNATLIWCGHRVGLINPEYPELTFELICSYVLWPFAFVMGTDYDDCRKVAELIGTKTFLNEFIAYTRLGDIIKNRVVYDDYMTEYGATLPPVKTYDWSYDLYLPEYNTTLVGGVLSKRSEVIATYSLCGFANFGSIGVMLGGLGAMAPKRKKDMARIVVRAMIAGNVACFITACIAGLLYEDFEDVYVGGTVP